MTMLVGAAASAATSPVTAPKATAQTATVSNVTVTTTAEGTATVSKVKTNKKKVTVPTTVEVNGVKYTVTAIAMSINTENSLKVAKKTFKGRNTKKVVIKVNKKMSKKQLKAFKKNLKAAGFKGTVKATLK